MKEIFVIKSVEGKPPEITPKKKLQSNPKQYRTLKHLSISTAENCRTKFSDLNVAE